MKTNVESDEGASTVEGAWEKDLQDAMTDDSSARFSNDEDEEMAPSNRGAVSSLHLAKANEEITVSRGKRGKALVWACVAIALFAGIGAVTLGVILGSKNKSSASVSAPKPGNTAPQASPTGDEPPQQVIPATVTEAAAMNSDWTIFTEALTFAKLVDQLDGKGPFTVFAPINNAFANMDQGMLTKMLDKSGDWILHLRNLLLLHVTSDEAALSFEQMTEDAKWVMMNNEAITVTIHDNNVKTLTTNYNQYVNVESSSRKIVKSQNGQVQAIEKVLKPGFMLFDTLTAARQTNGFATVSSWIVLAGLQDQFRSDAITFFAPYDPAFQALPSFLVTYLEDPSHVQDLSQVLLYHVVPRVYPSQKLLAQSTLDTVQGQSLTVTVDSESNILINGDVKIEAADALSKNGISHAITSLLIPSNVLPLSATLALQQNDLSTFFQLVQKAALIDVLSNEQETFTVFAPTDAAFIDYADQSYLQQLMEDEDWILHLQGLVYYYVSSAGALSWDDLTTTGYADGMDRVTMLNHEFVIPQLTGAEVVLTNAEADTSATLEADYYGGHNGVLYKIDSVLNPGFMNHNIYQSIDVTSGLTILKELIDLAGLKDMLSTKTLTLLVVPDTVWANFAHLNYLRDPSNISVLQRVLQYHIIAGVHPSTLLLAGLDGLYRTMETSFVTAAQSPDGTKIMINDATLTQTDGLSRNGIAHLVDQVLIPEGVTFD